MYKIVKPRVENIENGVDSIKLLLIQSHFRKTCGREEDKEVPPVHRIDWRKTYDAGGIGLL